MSYLDKSALRLVGTRPIRPDGVDKVTRRANFSADMTMPGMLWGRLKLSTHAHARLRALPPATPRQGAGLARRQSDHNPRRFYRRAARARPYRRGAAQSARPVAE